MRKKLLILDLALAAAAVVLGVRARDRWFEAEKRTQTVLGYRLQPVPAPPFKPLPQVHPVASTEYGDVVQKYLFSGDRNPTVIVEVAPPKPMPELPVFYGVMNLGDGPMAIMAVKANQSPREVKFGEKVGEFKLIAANTEDITLEWDGKTITRKSAELEPKGPPSNGADSGGAAAAAPAARRAPEPKQQVAAAPGRDIGAGFRACAMGDTSPAGTIRDGMRKVKIALPIGETCRWEPVK